jgi:hypothetical protein
MAPRINMADPDYEPTDEQLVQLVREAFSGVKAANDRVLAQFWRDIAVATKLAASPESGGHDPSSQT